MTVYHMRSVWVCECEYDMDRTQAKRNEYQKDERKKERTNETTYMPDFSLLLLLLPLLLNKRLNSRSSHDSRYLVYVLCLLCFSTYTTRWCCNRPYHIYSKMLFAHCVSPFSLSPTLTRSLLLLYSVIKYYFIQSCYSSSFFFSIFLFLFLILCPFAPCSFFSFGIGIASDAFFRLIFAISIIFGRSICIPRDKYKLQIRSKNLAFYQTKNTPMVFSLAWSKKNWEVAKIIDRIPSNLNRKMGILW